MAMALEDHKIRNLNKLLDKMAQLSASMTALEDLLSNF